MTMLVLQGSPGTANFTLFTFFIIYFAENPTFVVVPGHYGYLFFVSMWVMDIQGDPKKMSHSVLQLKSVVGVQSYFFRGVSESEFRARSN